MQNKRFVNDLLVFDDERGTYNIKTKIVSVNDCARLNRILKKYNEFEINYIMKRSDIREFS